MKQLLASLGGILLVFLFWLIIVRRNEAAAILVGAAFVANAINNLRDQMHDIFCRAKHEHPERPVSTEDVRS